MSSRNYLTKEMIEEAITTEKHKAGAARKLGIALSTLNGKIRKFGIKYKPRFTYGDLTGKKFNRLLVLEKTDTTNALGGIKWKCQCDCGKICYIVGASIVKELSRSCGCLKREKLRVNHYEEISAQWWRRIRQHAIKRDMIFEIEMEYVWNLYEKQGKRCALTGLEIFFSPDGNKPHLQTVSIDRINSKIGYTKDNIQLVHKFINEMKTAITQEQFIAFCNLVALKHEVDYETAKKIFFESNIRPLGHSGSR